MLTPLLITTLALAGSISPLVEPYVQANDFHGVIGWEIAGEETILPLGLASQELGTPHEAEGIFRIGSISKQFTAAAILLLQEDAQLDVQATVDNYLDGLAWGDQVTIEQLLEHRSGVVDVYSLASYGESGGLHGDADAVLAEIGGHPLTFEPGSRFSYSNGGYVVLAAIIEAVSGMSYGEFLWQRIFEPLGMDQSAHDAPGAVVPGRVPGYNPYGVDGLSPAPPLHPAYLRGAGSLWSSAGDLLRWARALREGTLLSDVSFQALIADGEAGYGFGVSVFERFGRAAIGHDGRLEGYASDLCIYPEDDAAVVVLSNVQSVVRDRIRVEVAAELFNEEAALEPRPSLRTASAEELLPLPGAYEFGPGFVVYVRAVEGRLLARANEGAETELIPTTDGQWYNRALDAVLRFEDDTAEGAGVLSWGPRERAMAGTRIAGAGGP